MNPRNRLINALGIFSLTLTSASLTDVKSVCDSWRSWSTGLNSQAGARKHTCLLIH